MAELDLGSVATEHYCFSRETLVNFQLGKLAPSQIVLVASEIELCPRCDAALAALDDVDDSVVSVLHSIAPSAPDSGVLGIGSKSPDCQHAERSSVDWTGRRLGQYVLKEQIGRGGMATVWRALHQSLKRERAVKLLPVNRLVDRESIQRFFREIEFTGRLEHPNLVLAHDAGEEGGQPYLAMELLDGCNLGELVQRWGRLPVPVACELARQAAIGLAHAHAHQSIHRDVKPSNLFLTRAGVVKVLDLGLARSLDTTAADMTRDDRVMGTPLFMSPEQFQTPRLVGPAADIYSLGCTLYCLLIGEAPFAESAADGIFSLSIAHATKSPQKFEELRAMVPSKLFALIDQMLAKSPGDRPSDMNSVAERLAPFCTDAVGALKRLLESHSQSQLSPTISLEQSTAKVATHPSRRLVAAFCGGTALVLLIGWITLTFINAQPDRESQGPNRAGVSTPEETATHTALTLLDLPEELKSIVIETVRRHPGSGPWSGRAGRELFAIRAVPVPAGKGGALAIPVLTSSATTQAIADLVQTKSLLKRYSDAGLTDAATLRAAFVRAAGDVQFSATMKRLSTQARRVDDYVVAIARADEDAMIVGATSETTTELVKAAYREVMHQHSRELMARGEWNDALSLWQHLHQRRLVSADLYLDAARCFHALGKDVDALRMLSETLDLFAEQARWELLEQAGVLATEIQGEAAEKIAQRSFELALQRFQGAPQD